MLLNKFDSRTSLSHEILSTLIRHPIYGDRLFKAYVRASQEFPNSITNNETIFDHMKASTAKEDIDLLIVPKDETDTNRKFPLMKE